MTLRMIAIDKEDTVYVAIDKIVSVESQMPGVTRVYAQGARGWTLQESIEDVLARLLQLDRAQA